MDHDAAFHAGLSEDVRGLVSEERRAEGEEEECEAFHVSGLKRGRAREISAKSKTLPLLQIPHILALIGLMLFSACDSMRWAVSVDA
jgi:hypothetical protein